MQSDTHQLTELLLVQNSVKTETKIVIHTETMNQTKKLIIYALGIFVCYFYFGIFQEKM